MEFVAAKISEILVLKSALKRIFDVLYTEQKLSIFSFQAQFSRSKINFIFSKMIFYMNIKLGEQLLLATFLRNFI